MRLQYIIAKYSVETTSLYNILKEHKMFKFIKKLFAKQPSALEEFLASKAIKTHADVEYWAKYFEYRGL